jgi:hypothetical protein
MQMISRSDARAAGLLKFFVGEPCSQGHIADRYVSSGKCVQCNSERCAKRRTEKADQVKEEKRAYYEANKELLSEQRKAKYRAAPDAAIARSRRRFQEKRQEVLEQNREHRRKNWERIKESRRARHASEQSARKAAKIKRTPQWLTERDRLALRAKYAEARWMTIRTGIKHEVDHYYPLQGELVSGLHTPGNLRVIPGRENWRKSTALPKTERLPL